MPSHKLVLTLLILIFLQQSLLNHADHTHSDSNSDSDSDSDSDSEDSSSSDFSSSQFGSEGEDPDEDIISILNIDEKDVVILKERNFSDVVDDNKYVLVQFYAPWCEFSKTLAPEFAAAATRLKEDGVDVVLAKVDATKENELSQHFDVKGFPTLFFFVDGDHMLFDGQRTKDAIVTWIKKKTGSVIFNITTTEEAEKILTSNEKVVVAYLNSLTGPESQELTSASGLENEVIFYQTVEENVAKLFEIDPQAKRPALVLLKKDAEKINYFDGKFVKSAISEFVLANKHPLVTTFTKESATVIFGSKIKKQVLLFATSSDSEKVLPAFTEAAKIFKGKLIFVYVQLDDDENGKPVADFFGVVGNAPQVIAYTGNADPKKFILEGEVTFEKVKAFGDGFLEDKLKPFHKSDPIPESNDGDVKIVVGANFDEIVLDESKDVLLEIYAPWCGHCQTLEPIYKKLAQHFRGVDSIVIAKMDGTANEHPRAKAGGFPTILFFPAGKKSSDPITVDTDRTVVAFSKFLKKHAAIPFTLQKPTSSSENEDAKDLKDEL